MKKEVFIILLKVTAVDYYDSCEEIVGVYANIFTAQAAVNKLNSKRDYNVKYYIAKWTVK